MTGLLLAAALQVVIPNERLEPCFAANAYTETTRSQIVEKVRVEVSRYCRRFAELKIQAAREFASVTECLQKERFFKRMEMAERSCKFAAFYARRGDNDGCGFAERALGDLKVFEQSFVDELKYWQKSPQNPQVKAIEIKATDYGMKGDGVTDAYEPMQRALAAVRALDGKPSVVRLPAGKLIFRGIGGYHFKAQLSVVGIANCMITGEGSDKTSVSFGVYDERGVMLECCTNVTIVGMELKMEKTPFFLGKVLTVESDNDAIVCQHIQGTLLPDDAEWNNQPAGRDEPYCGHVYEAETGRLFCDASHNRYAVKSDNLGDGKWRLYFVSSPEYTHRNMKPGMMIAIPNRKNGIPIAGGIMTAYSTWSDIIVRNSREAAFSCGETMIGYWRCKLEPEKGKYMSSNADAMYTGRSTSIFHSSFRGAADDCVNLHSFGVKVKGSGVAREVFAITPWFRGQGMMMLVNRKNGEMRNIGADESLPEVEHDGTYALFSPDSGGTAPVVSDCVFADCRGGFVVQAANALIEDVSVVNAPGGVQVGGLVFVPEGPAPYNCTFRRVSFADCRWRGFHSNVHAGGFYQLPNRAPIRGISWEDCTVRDCLAAPVKLANLADSLFVRLRIEGKGPKEPVTAQKCENVRFIDCMAIFHDKNF